MIPAEPLSESRTQTICLAFLAAVAGTYLIYWLRPVLVPLVVAMFVVSGVSPILSVLQSRLGLSRIAAAGTTFLAGLVILVIFGSTIWVSVLELSSNADAYTKRVRELVLEIEDMLPTSFAQPGVLKPGLLNPESAPPESPPTELAPQPESPPTDTSLPAVSTAGVVALEPVPQASPDLFYGQTQDDVATREKMARVSQFVDSLVRQGIATLSQSLLSLVSTSMVVLIYVFFLLIGTPSIHHSPTLRELDQQVRSYLSTKTVISIVTGLAFGMALRLFGVPMAFAFGVLAFLLNFVPNVGPIVASLLPIPLIILDPTGSIGWMIAVIAVICSIQLISGNIVEPKIMGDQSDLHPVTILVALMFWGMMWGVIGMFLATPITSAMKLMLERFPSTKSLANLMAGRWESAG